MIFNEGHFSITVSCGKPCVEYYRGGSGLYTSVVFKAPEPLVHMAFKRDIMGIISKGLKIHNITEEGNKDTNPYVATTCVAPKCLRYSYSGSSLMKSIQERIGDIEEAKDNWDYNKAPKNATVKGKFGDLKAFIEMKSGKSLNL